MLNFIAEIISSAFITPETLYDTTLYFISKDKAPNLTSVGQTRNLFFLDAIMDLGCFTLWQRAHTCE